MNDASHQQQPSALAGQIVARAGLRLEGRWDDPAAWRVLCEEAAAAWSGRPDVRWALIVPRPEAAPAGVVGPGAAALWTASAAGVRWLPQAGTETLWRELAAAGGVLGGPLGAAPVSLGLQPPDDGQVASWLALGIPGGRNFGLAVVLGLSRVATEGAGTDPRQADLMAVSTLLAPLLGQQRRLSDVATEAAALRAECETLSRLGELRARLAAVTAHELKTPLTSITAYAEVLEQQIGDPAFQHAEEFLRVIRGEADRLLRLVDRLLDSSRRGRSQALSDPQPVAVEELARGVLHLMAPQASARDLRLVARIPDALPPLAGDADLVRQVLLNLLGNALKFTPAGGRVVLAGREDASSIRLEVIDDGPGIPPHELRAIFQSFYRAPTASQAEGVGLGLSIVKEIVGLHGGHLDVHSRLGRGSTFAVLLPKAQRHAEGDSALTQAGADPVLLRRLGGHSLRLVAELAAARGVAVLLPAAQPDSYVVAAAMGLECGAAGATVPAAALPDLAGTDGGAQLVCGADVLPGVLGQGSRRPGDAMLAPLDGGPAAGPPPAGARPGLLLACRRLGGGVFGADDRTLLGVLAEILGLAWQAALAPGADRRDHETVTEALVALAGLRRTGVPTADPLALRLLSRTGRRLGLSSYEIRLLQYAGALHDAGMVLVDPEVVLKPADLDLDERDHIGRHPQRGLDLLGPLVAVPELQAIIRHHHERVDGRGYPEGRRGEAIPLGARILAVVDAFFAMIRSRPWRDGLPVSAAVAEIQSHAGAQFDRRVVAAFLGVLLEEGLLAEPAAPTVSGGPRR